MKTLSSILLTLVLTSVILFTPDNYPLLAASFTCEGIKQPFAVAVCSDVELSELDSSLVAKYTAARDGL